MLAKTANRIAQKSNIGVFTQPETVLDRIAVDDIWGIGKNWGKWLIERGITFARSSPFKNHFHCASQAIELNNPSNDTIALLHATLSLTDKIFVHGVECWDCNPKASAKLLYLTP